MADTLAEAIELVELYKEKTEEHVQGLAEVKQFCENAAETMVATLGEDNEQAAILADAGTATDVVLGLAQSTAAELGELLRVLNELK